MYHALIMAGGSGTRLWPLSRKASPKQALPLLETRTMVQLTVDRLKPLIPSERVHIVTNAAMAGIFKTQLDLPAQNYIIEPGPKDSGPAAALGLAHIHAHDPDAVVAVLAADHHITDEAGFRAVLVSAETAARMGYIVTLGITPTEPSTGFGYVERGAPIMNVTAAHQIFQCVRFVEKPPAEVARAYFSGGRHAWNSGMFILSSAAGLGEFTRQHPDFAATFGPLRDAIGTAAYDAALGRMWHAAPKKSIDYAIMENAQRIAVIPMSVGWNDIGSWASLFEVLPGDDQGNVLQGDRQVLIDTRRSLIRSGTRTVAAIGLDDIVIIDTPDALLVCRKDRVQDVKQVVEQLKAAGMSGVL
jgi:mannose-1-phosphate guanylyltransferase